MDDHKHTYQSEECKVLHESMLIRLQQLEQTISDHRQRFDTLQTPWWKRVLFKINGWPWYNLNGKQAHRPWHKKDGEK